VSDKDGDGHDEWDDHPDQKTKVRVKPISVIPQKCFAETATALLWWGSGTRRDGPSDRHGAWGTVGSRRDGLMQNTKEPCSRQARSACTAVTLNLGKIGLDVGI
jgi:hypothetical protein